MERSHGNLPLCSSYAVLVFGDPNNGSAFGTIPSSKTKVICHPLDGICLHTAIVDADHLTYAVEYVIPEPIGTYYWSF